MALEIRRGVASRWMLWDTDKNGPIFASNFKQGIKKQKKMLEDFYSNPKIKTEKIRNHYGIRQATFYD